MRNLTYQKILLIISLIVFLLVGIIVISYMHIVVRDYHLLVNTIFETRGGAVRSLIQFYILEILAIISIIIIIKKNKNEEKRTFVQNIVLPTALFLFSLSFLAQGVIDGVNENILIIIIMLCLMIFSTVYIIIKLKK